MEAPLSRMPPVSAAKVATIDVTEGCPSRCVFCAKTKVLNSGREMGLPLYGEIIRRMPSLERANHGGGDPFSNLLLARMLELCFGKGIHADVSVSGLVWNADAVAVAIANKGSFSLQINVPAAQADAFERITGAGGGMFDVFGANVARLIDEFGPLVRMRMALCKQNLAQLPHVSEFAHRLGAPLNVSLAIYAGGNHAMRLNREEILSARLIVAGDATQGRKIQFHGPHGGKTGCPAIARTYGFELVRNACDALDGTSVYIDVTGKHRPCDFLG